MKLNVTVKFVILMDNETPEEAARFIQEHLFMMYAMMEKEDGTKMSHQLFFEALEDK